MPQQLSIKNLSAVPFKADVEAMIKQAFAPLVDSGELQIDMTGTKAGTYVLSFQGSYEWSDLSRRGCQFMPHDYGVTGTVSLEAIERKNFCTDVTKCHTCECQFRNSKDELGKQIGQTAVHEIGHLFGLQDAKAFAGADSSGESGDAANFMFAITSHKDYKRLEEDSQRTRKYTIVKGDTLSKIVLRIGFRPPNWQKLYGFKGMDGKSNKELLRSGDPNLIFPGRL